MNFSSVSRASIAGRLLRLPLRLIPRNLPVPVLQGPLRGKRWIVGSFTHGCWLGSYEYEKQKMVASLVRPGNVVYDIGAHVGFYTLLFAQLVGPSGHVYAFEPNPRNLAYLRTHIKLNHYRNVTLVPSALSDTTGPLRFEGQLGSNATGHLSDTGSIEVQSFRLDEWIRQHRPKQPDYLKVDIEGAEARMLAGATQTLRVTKPSIFLATHGAVVHSECARMLENLGYLLQPIGNAEDELIATPASKSVTA